MKSFSDLTRSTEAPRALHLVARRPEHEPVILGTLPAKLTWVRHCKRLVGTTNSWAWSPAKAKRSSGSRPAIYQGNVVILFT